VEHAGSQRFGCAFSLDRCPNFWKLFVMRALGLLAVIFLVGLFVGLSLNKSAEGKSV
jgi:hypothetical protein